jgi:hypothetical protein
MIDSMEDSTKFEIVKMLINEIVMQDDVDQIKESFAVLMAYLNSHFDVFYDKFFVTTSNDDFPDMLQRGLRNIAARKMFLELPEPMPLLAMSILHCNRSIESMPKKVQHIVMEKPIRLRSIGSGKWKLEGFYHCIV